MAALESPLVTNRKRIPQDVIDNLINEIAQAFSPNKIILFGSYASGNTRPESDIDLLVVVDKEDKGERKSLAIRRHLGVMFGLDIIVYSTKRLEERIRKGDWFLREIVETGKVVYERINP